MDGIRRTSTHLADGRELIYFDDSPSAWSTPRDAVDGRDLAGLAPAGTLRFDALTGDWVAVAGHRLNRTFLPPTDECPLCPTGRGSIPSEVPASSYDVVVFENRFPSFSTVPTSAPEESMVGSPAWLLRERPATGRCEVVCFTDDHDAQFSSLSATRARTVVEAWVDRTRELSALPGVELVFPFENRGREIGVTLSHPHGQIYAYPFVPARARAVWDQAREYHRATGRVLGADLLAAELADGSRVVLSGTHWTAYVPFAARWPVEVHLVPHRDVADLPGLAEEERAELAVVYLDLLRRLDGYYTEADGSPIDLPYIAGWHQAPVQETRQRGAGGVSRLHLQVMSVLRAPGRLKYLAGSESGVGGWVNDVPPERIAARLREL